MSKIAFLAFYLLSWVAFAQNVTFDVRPDRSTLGKDDSLVVQFIVQIEGRLRGDVAEPTFELKNLVEVQSYQSQSSSVQSINGNTTITATVQFTKIFEPKSPGEGKIEKIKIRAAGKNLTAKDVVVSIKKGVVKKSGKQRRGAVPQDEEPEELDEEEEDDSDAPLFFVKAELDKEKVFKGERIRVSYYLYQRVRTFNPEVTKYPILKGFLREDLEMPVLGRRLARESAKAYGRLYTRALLVRYAAYPLKLGKLSIDGLELRANYYPPERKKAKRSGRFDPFSQIFRSLNPKRGKRISDPVEVEVVDLPQGPESFSGGVGDFTVTAKVDRYVSKANEPLTFRVVVSGEGNIGSIDEPKIEFPPFIERFESSSSVRKRGVGVAEKTFEYLLIPRAAGDYTLPSVSLTYFDPDQKEYLTEATEPIELTSIANSGAPSIENYLESAKDESKEKRIDPFDRLLPTQGLDHGRRNLLLLGQDPIRLGFYLLVFAFIFSLLTLFIGVYRVLAQARTPVAQAKLSFEALKKKTKEAIIEAKKNPSEESLKHAYAQGGFMLHRMLEICFDVAARARSREDLRLELQGKVPPELWKEIELILTQAEAAVYAATDEKERVSALEGWHRSLIGVLDQVIAAEKKL